MKSIQWGKKIMSNGPLCLEVECWNLIKKIDGFESTRQNRLVIEREVLPIIFIPGIMGSRLKNGDDVKIWDPDSSGFMFWKYGVFLVTTAQTKKELLVGEKFSPVFAKVHNLDPEQISKLANAIDATREERGWEECLGIATEIF